MPSTLRAKTALVALFGVLMIPLWTSSLRGLTHVLTCNQVTDTDFSIDVDPDGMASVLSSVTFERGEASRELCGGLVVDVGVSAGIDGSTDLVISIENDSEFDWQGSVQVDLDDVSFPIALGKISTGHSETETVGLNLAKGRSYQMSGNLLIGP